MEGDSVLVTRPEPGAAETAARVAALGWRPVLAPALVLAPRPHAAPLLPPAQAILLTSRAAARALAPPSPCPPVIAVGEATAAEARAAGFPAVSAAPGGGDAASLAAHVAATLDPAAGPLLLAVGAGYARDLEAALRARGFRVLRRVVYAARPAQSLPEPARAALAEGRVAAALFLSPRSAECAMSLLRAAGLGATIPTIEALCISERVARAAAAAAAPHRWRATRVAARPDQDSMLQLLGPRRCPPRPAAEPR